jgi:probable HAF family extracellular repeat protein
MMRRQTWWAMVLSLGAILGPAGGAGAVTWPLAQGMVDVGALSTNPADPADKGTSHARGLNDLGQVVGDSMVYNPGNTGPKNWTHAFLWTAGTGMVDLGTPPGAAATDNTSATAINNSGQIAVNYGLPNSAAYIYAGGQWTKLGMLGSSTAVYAINQKGETTGAGYATNPTTGEPEWHAVKWSAAGAPAELGQLPGAWWGSQAQAINDFGLVVGWSTTTNECIHAVLWTGPGQMQDLGALLEPDPNNFGTDSYATGINNNGAVVGFYSGPATGGLERAFLWTAAGGMVYLGTLPNGNSSHATAINDQGQITGWAHGVWQDHGGTPYEVINPFIWANGQMQDLGPWELATLIQIIIQGATADTPSTSSARWPVIRLPTVVRCTASSSTRPGKASNCRPCWLSIPLRGMPMMLAATAGTARSSGRP